VQKSPEIDPMALAIAEAKLAAGRGEVPVGAVIVDPADGSVLAQGGNLVEGESDPTAHAEIVAIRQACRAAGRPRLDGFDLYVTLEPCAMCAQAIAHARIRRLYFGAYDPKGGGVEHGARVFERPTCHHRPEVYGGLREAENAALLKDFFSGLRQF
jgi:tRNA(Arg) A34 adenosine deaminase TadA